MPKAESFFDADSSARSCCRSVSNCIARFASEIRLRDPLEHCSVFQERSSEIDRMNFSTALEHPQMLPLSKSGM
ncbi:hypothetical protein BGW36DRAFT_367602 [Talaromyces proteolyticus]|uniref:Uncharacterized protein n=1 Tax=Talaromyces proteolyticus TaxID=1131652 RepID=A0AAD4Q6A6_9EURO|nr:uncharacterized protein BGW36DRAFT_367602 [Talaromyces proteolyticus]KAH8705448.1 hypothetical protein BGW36DRAFT_367602 [Talaromyces proteolyticus]